MTDFVKLSSMLAILLISTALAQNANAAIPAPPHSRAGLAQLGDPYVPPRVRAAARAQAARNLLATQPSVGASLQTQALEILHEKFDQADSKHQGRVTKDQARQAGFGFVANHFEQIDSQHRGSVSFGELKAFMRAKGANF